MAAFSLFAVALLSSLDLDALEAAEDAELARLNWAAGMREIRLWEDGVEDEVMVMVNQNADKAEVMDPVSHQGILTLQSWTLVVLENQLVVAYNGQPRASERNAGAESAATYTPSSAPTWWGCLLPAGPSQLPSWRQGCLRHRSRSRSATTIRSW